MPAKSLLGSGQAEAPWEQAPPSGQGACLPGLHVARGPCPRALLQSPVCTVCCSQCPVLPAHATVPTSLGCG